MGMCHERDKATSIAGVDRIQTEFRHLPELWRCHDVRASSVPRREAGMFSFALWLFVYEVSQAVCLMRTKKPKTTGQLKKQA